MVNFGEKRRITMEWGAESRKIKIKKISESVGRVS